MYYLLLCIGVVMSGVQFFFNDAYRRSSGDGLRAALLFVALTGTAGLPALLIINRFRLAATPFTLVMALAAGVNSLLCTVFGQKALGKTNLSVYSLFMMLGGMALPAVFGIAFYGEPFTPAVALCFALITAALAVTVKRGGKGGLGWCVGIFIFNGLSGVIVKTFQTLPFAKADSGSFSFFNIAFYTAVAAAAFAFTKGGRVTVPKTAWIPSVGSGVLSAVSGFMYVVAASGLPASVQYPFITGGVIIVSTLLAYFTPEKPGVREWAGALLSLAGIAALMLL